MNSEENLKHSTYSALTVLLTKFLGEVGNRQTKMNREMNRQTNIQTKRQTPGKTKHGRGNKASYLSSEMKT